MDKMGIVETPYIIVRHNDTEHPHCHIVFSRIDNYGKTISDKNDRVRNVKACRELTDKYLLYVAPGKESVKREQLRGTDRIKYEIYDAVKAALPHCLNWDELQNRLEGSGITVTFKDKGNTGQKEGVIFTKDGQSFNGSKVDRQFSFSKLDAALEVNARNSESREASQSVDQQSQNESHYMWPTENSWIDYQETDEWSRSLSDSETPAAGQQSRNGSDYMWPTENSWDGYQETDEWSRLIRAMNPDYDEDEMEARRRRKKKKGYSI